MSSSSSCSMLCFVLLLSLHLYSAAASDCIALLQFVDSFTITEYASHTYFCYNSYPKTGSWNNGTDCCSWDGVTCDNFVVGSGRNAVIELELSCSWLRGLFLSNSSLFSLRSLKRLNLAGNDFDASEIPSRFHLFSDMTHLNLSSSLLAGLIPREIAHLSKLESLDLSSGFLAIEDNVLKSIMHNLTRLRRLALDGTDMAQASSFTNLSSSSLNYLSLSSCDIRGFMVSDLFRLPKLQYLYLSGNNFFDTLSSSNWTSPLLALDLSKSDLEGRLLEKIATLKTLNYLNLQSNDLTGEIPEAIGNLIALEYLDLSSTSLLTGEIPASIGNLTALEHLDLSRTSIRGSIPSTLVNLEQLSYLNLEGNVNMSGVVDFEIFANMRRMTTLYFPVAKLNVVVQDGGNGSFPELTDLRLCGCNLTKFPYFLSSSKGLQYLDLSKNMITGPIPRWLWSLGNDTLDELHLSDNLITGFLSPFPWKKVRSVYIMNNLLVGELLLPPSATMMYYDASNNNFTGIIPSSICQFSQLWYLALRNNQLSGTIPGCISNLTLLEVLDVSSNHLKGPLPRSLSNCTTLMNFYVGYNRINDTLSDWLPNSLQYLNLQSNDFHGPVQTADRLPFIEIYNIADNAFTGHWPTDYFLNSTEFFSVLDLSKNNFVGPILLPPPNVTYYDVSDNNFTGEIPYSICDTTGLKVINLSNNSLVGSIPRCLAKTSATLSILNLRNNKLIGEIPQLFALVNCLRTVDLSRNNLSGTVPRSLANCKDLEVLDLSNNAIEDVFPSWLAALPKLRVLVIRSNLFYGHVQYDSGESVVHPFCQLCIFDISVNQFSGPLPTKYMANFEAMMDNSELGNLEFVSNKTRGYTYKDSIRVVMKGNEFELVKILKVFTTIDLSSNFFEGEFPGVVGNLKALKGLNFSHNHITGNISSSVRNLKKLEWLDLSSNNLSGEIPPGMADLTFLGTLNLSRNQLSGPIPTGPQFNTYSSDAFEGNPQLCGFPLPKECGSKDDQDPPPPNNIEEDAGEDLWMEWKAVPVGYIFGIVFGFTIGYIFW